MSSKPASKGKKKVETTINFGSIPFKVDETKQAIEQFVTENGERLFRKLSYKVNEMLYRFLARPIAEYLGVEFATQRETWFRNCKIAWILKPKDDGYNQWRQLIEKELSMDVVDNTIDPAQQILSGVISGRVFIDKAAKDFQKFVTDELAKIRSNSKRYNDLLGKRIRNREVVLDTQMKRGRTDERLKIMSMDMDEYPQFLVSVFNKLEWESLFKLFHHSTLVKAFIRQHWNSIVFERYLLVRGYNYVKDRQLYSMVCLMCPFTQKLVRESILGTKNFKTQHNSMMKRKQFAEFVKSTQRRLSMLALGKVTTQSRTRLHRGNDDYTNSLGVTLLELTRNSSFTVPQNSHLILHETGRYLENGNVFPSFVKVFTDLRDAAEYNTDAAKPDNQYWQIQKLLDRGKKVLFLLQCFHSDNWEYQYNGRSCYEITEPQTIKRHEIVERCQPVCDMFPKAGFVFLFSENPAPVGLSHNFSSYDMLYHTKYLYVKKSDESIGTVYDVPVQQVNPYTYSNVFQYVVNGWRDVAGNMINLNPDFIKPLFRVKTPHDKKKHIISVEAPALETSLLAKIEDNQIRQTVDEDEVLVVKKKHKKT